jgi:hypothetical protein
MNTRNRSQAHRWASSKLGARVSTLREFSGVPAGTTGTVTRADGPTVAITWDLPHRQKPLTDWFTRTEFEAYTQEAAR